MSSSFGRYRLDRVLGRGGMGVVHAAHDTVLDREVALKIVAPHLAGDPEFRARFQHEAEVLARLDSDRIVRIFDHGEHEGSLFIVTQLVDGGDLQQLVAGSGPLSPALAVEVVCQVLEGLRAAHAVGVIHRDIKPANVLLRQRHGEVEAFLCDFGIAAAAGGGFTMTGGVAGSLPYMAPERHRGEDATPASDVYAVGCLLWHGLTGSAPYAGTDVEVAMAHIEGRVPQLPGRDEFSRRMNAVLARAMAKDPRKRYPGARAMIDALRPLLDIAPGVIALPGATAIRRPVLRRRRWTPALVGAGSVLAVVAVVGGLVWLGSADELSGGRDALPVPATLTETVSVRGGLLLGNHVTLGPAPVRITQADGDVVLEPPPAREELPPAEAASPGGRAPSRPRAGSTGPAAAPSGSAAPQPTTAPPPPPGYRCWNGVLVHSLDSCQWPTGLAGARWVWSGMQNLPNCNAFDNPNTTQDLEAWSCIFKHSDGSTVHMTFQRWTSSDAAVAYFRDRLEPDYNSPWNLDEYLGRIVHGRIGASRRLVSARIYAVAGTQPWSMSVQADTHEIRQHHVLRISPRGTGDFRGVRR